jgi:hypothetical protein
MQSLTPTRELTSMCRRAVPPIGRSIVYVCVCEGAIEPLFLLKLMGSN